MHDYPVPVRTKRVIEGEVVTIIVKVSSFGLVDEVLHKSHADLVDHLEIKLFKFDGKDHEPASMAAVYGFTAFNVADHFHLIEIMVKPLAGVPGGRKPREIEVALDDLLLEVHQYWHESFGEAPSSAGTDLRIRIARAMAQYLGLAAEMTEVHS